LRREKTHGVRVKCRDDGWTAGRLCLCNRLTRNGLMPAMKAIKIAQSHHATAQGVRHPVFSG
jgi:hypothetical protein